MPAIARPRADKDRALALFLQSLTWPAIAEQSNVPIGTLRKWAAKDNWEALRSNTKRSLEQTATAGMALSVANDMNARSKATQEGLAEVLLGQVEVLKKNPGRTISQLRNTPQGQGSAAVAKTIAETAAKVFGWDAAQSRSIVNVNILNQVPDNTIDI